MKITKLIKSIFHFFGIEVTKYYSPNYTWLKRENINTVIDIGANTGQFALKIAKIFPEAKIYSFEPIKSCYNELISKTKKLKIKVFNVALGEMEYTTAINVSSHSPSSSLLEMERDHKELFKHTAQSKEETIQVKTLDSILNINDLNKNILIKIDVQGFEASVLRGGLNLIDEAKIIIIEINYYQLYKNQTSFHEIYSILSKYNFQFAGNLNQTFNHKTGDIIYSDSIFIKN